MKKFACHLEFPPKGRCSIEIIKELDKIVIDLLQVFASTCGNRLPNRLVFYRDGVDDGQFQKVLDNEIDKIKHACRGKKFITFLQDHCLNLCYLFSCLRKGSITSVNIYNCEEKTSYTILYV